jgi:uncharacterized protein (DUF952 family)
MGASLFEHRLQLNAQRFSTYAIRIGDLLRRPTESQLSCQPRFGGTQSKGSRADARRGHAPRIVASVAAMTAALIYHMCHREEWRAAESAGAYRGSSQDAADGFIHFSTATQIEASAAKHRAGERDLVLLAVDAAALGAALKWESARDGALFPHLYGALPLAAVRWAKELPLGTDGRHVFPSLPAW